MPPSPRASASSPALPLAALSVVGLSGPGLVAGGMGCEASADLDSIPGAQLLPGPARCLLKGLPGSCACSGHGLLTAFEVVQQWAVGAGELAAVVLADLEQSGVAPTVQGPFADSEPIGGLTLNGPGHGLDGHAGRRKEQAEDPQVDRRWRHRSGGYPDLSGHPRPSPDRQF